MRTTLLIGLIINTVCFAGPNDFPELSLNGPKEVSREMASKLVESAYKDGRFFSFEAQSVNGDGLAFPVASALCRLSETTKEFEIIKFSLSPTFADSQDLAIPLIQKILYSARSLSAKTVTIGIPHSQGGREGMEGVFRGSLVDPAISSQTGFRWSTTPAKSSVSSIRLEFDVAALDNLKAISDARSATPGLSTLTPFFSGDLDSPAQHLLPNLVGKENWLIVPHVVNGKVVSTIALQRDAHRLKQPGNFLLLRGMYDSAGSRNTARINYLLDNAAIDPGRPSVSMPIVAKIPANSTCSEVLSKFYQFQQRALNRTETKVLLVR